MSYNEETLFGKKTNFMDLGINGKTALVTGAGRGLGEGICLSLNKEGVRIIALSRSKEPLVVLSNKLVQCDSGANELITADLSKSGETDSVISELLNKKIQPDIIVNNAGGGMGSRDPLKTFESWEKVAKLNLECAIKINEAFIPQMQKKQWGRICHISSIAALENQGPPSYCAAKAALNAYVRSLARYVAKDNVILTTLMPGAVFTEGGYWDETTRTRPKHVENYLKERMAIQRFGTINEISDAVTFLCSDLSSFCVGTNMLVDGGQGRVFHAG